MGQPPYNQQRGNMNGNMNVDALAELGLFSAGILHEVKNSLQSVGNALFLLENERDLAPKVRQEVAIARRELSRAFDVSAQTLALVRQESPVAMSVNDVVDEVLERYAGKITYKHVAIERQYKFTGSILSNPGAVRQVFANIVLNALESAPRNKGKLVIRTSACCNSKAASGVQIDFADNGPGIPETIHERVFYPLVSGREGGTGLGLTLAQNFVSQHHGTVTFESRPGRTVFYIMLPVVEGDPGAKA